VENVDTNVKLVLKWALKKSYVPWIFSGCEWNPLKFLFVGGNVTLISIKHNEFLQQ